MNGRDSKAEIFDVFLCHNGADKPAVREIAQKLKQEGIKPWLDEEQIRPGTSWQTALGRQIQGIQSAAVFVGDGGLGPWQNHEIQAFLNQLVERGCPVIPVILPSAKTTPDLPWTLKNLHRVDFRTDSQSLKRLVWGITGKRPAQLSDVPASDQPATMPEGTKSQLIPGSDEQAPKERLPPHTEPLDSGNARQLNILRRRVMEYWVDGVLKHSLYSEVLISLGKREMAKAIDAPWKYTVEVSGETNSTPLDDRNVSVIYDATGLLLILGEPGSGKTTTLLDLARTLLERARNDIRERVPIVVNLSSWKRQPLAEWIAVELSEKYRVPRKISHLWLQNDYLLPLLDGLDELETVLQPQCVAAINEFIEDIKPSGLLVCCRLNEYRWLPKRLQLNGAICIEPLNSEEVSKFLAAGGPKLSALREAVDGDPVLREFAQTPLMLSIMSLAFQGTDARELAEHTEDYEERRKQIFTVYVEQMFQRKSLNSLIFSKNKIIAWLSWLAGEMREDSQSIFTVEGVQPSWLGTTVKRVVYRAVVILFFGLIGALIGGLIGGLNGILILGFLAVLSSLFIASPDHSITLNKVINWNWKFFFSATIFGSTIGLIFGIILGLLFGWISGIVGLSALQDGSNPLLSVALNHALLFGRFFALLFGLGGVFGGSLAQTVEVGEVAPNQGIKMSLKNSWVLFLIIFLAAGLFFMLFGGLVVGLLGGLLFGILAWIVGGGEAVIRHYALRLILWWSGDTPLDLIKFLDQCDKLIFLKKVGGGYIFIHRMLLDYFADLNPQSTAIEKRGMAQVPASER